MHLRKRTTCALVLAAVLDARLRHAQTEKLAPVFALSCSTSDGVVS